MSMTAAGRWQQWRSGAGRYVSPSLQRRHIRIMASLITGNPTVRPAVHQRKRSPAFLAPLWGESTGDRWITRTNGQHAEIFFISWRHHNDQLFVQWCPMAMTCYVMTLWIWTYFPRDWPFLWRIYRLSVDSQHKESVMRSFDGSIVVNLEKTLNKQSSDPWNETM